MPAGPFVPGRTSRGKTARVSPSPRPLDAILRWPSPGARRWVEALAGWACRTGRLEAVVAVGSAVRPVAESRDVDLVLIHGGTRPDFPSPPRDVEIQLFEAEHVEALVAGGHDLLGWAVRFGKLLCERHAFWTTLCERWEGQLPLPSAEAAAERARRSAATLATLLTAAGDDAAAKELVTLLTQEARARLLRVGIFPTSRPELPDQLREIGQKSLAEALVDAVRRAKPPAAILSHLGIELPPTLWTPG